MKYITLFRGISKNISFPPILRVKKNYIASDLDLCLTVTLISHTFIPVFQSTIFFSYDIFLTRLNSIVLKPINVVVVFIVIVHVVFAKEIRSQNFLIQCPKSVGSKKKLGSKSFGQKKMFSKNSRFQEI